MNGKLEVHYNYHCTNVYLLDWAAVRTALMCLTETKCWTKCIAEKTRAVLKLSS